ncbi:hypothetical protein MVEN_00642000 [Mycena venus]|uniref:Uncharacterized protein n=1 Tax=Mycena venus TaxID=2733690 RepID=A0A8H6YQE4_9AGAR|nr:hypothetical protein MVEN_00642000 [Mycena venus]
MAAQLECHSVDKEGHKLTGNGEDAGDLSCVYGSSGTCVYNAAGDLNTEASPALCPSQMVNAASVGNDSQTATSTSGTSISSSISTSGTTTGKSPPVSSSPIPSNFPSATNPIASPTLSTAANPSNKNGIRTAAVAGSVTAVCVLIAIAVLIFWIRRRRKLVKQSRLPEQFVEAREQLLQDNSWPKGGIASPSNNVQRADPVDIEPDNNEDDEPITARMRRMEAQLQAILTMGLPEGSPPSYTG